jgi:hypothetical protein
LEAQEIILKKAGTGLVRAKKDGTAKPVEEINAGVCLSTQKSN